MFSLQSAYIITRKIIKIGNLLTNFRDADLKKSNLTSSQAETLIFFYNHPGAFASDLKEYMEISHQAARNLVERMRVKDFLITEVSNEDARAKHVYLTKKGQQMYGNISKGNDKAESIILKGLTAEEKEQLYLLLDKIHQNLI